MNLNLKKLFIPCQANDYTPGLLTKRALTAYVLILVVFNVFAADLNFNRAQAQVTSQSLYELHNRERAKNNLQDLSVNSTLIESATAKAQAMLNSNCWSHFCPDGTSPWIYFDDAGYDYVYAGENLAEGFETNESVITAWLNSPTHRANMLNANFAEIGIGFATGDFQGIENNTIVVVHFGSRSIEQPTNLAELPETGNDQSVTIDSPQTNSHLNNSQPDITGQKPFNSEIAITDNDQELGRVDANGNNYTFRPTQPLTEGSHDLQAVAYSGQFEIDRSNITTVTIDTKAPAIELDTLEVKSVSVNANKTMVIMTISITESPDGLKLSSNVASAKISYLEAYDWQFELNKNLLFEHEDFIITAVDQAGNSASVKAPVSNLTQDVLSMEQSIPQADDNKPSGLFSNFGLLLETKNLQAQVNIGFMGALSLIFLVDFYVLSKSGLTAITNRTKSHLHFGAIVIIILIALVGGLSGDILLGSMT